MGEFDEFEPYPQMLQQRAHPTPIQACKRGPVNTKAALGENLFLAAPHARTGRISKPLHRDLAFPSPP
jgi:hypothetical protein